MSILQLYSLIFCSSSDAILLKFMAPKLSAQQIDSKLADIRDHVRADLRNLVARGGATLKAVFRQVRKQQSHTEKAFLLFSVEV